MNIFKSKSGATAFTEEFISPGRRKPDSFGRLCQELAIGAIILIVILVALGFHRFLLGD